MATETFDLLPTASISLALQRRVPAGRRARTAAARTAGIGRHAGGNPEVRTSAIVEADGADAAEAVAERLGPDAEVERLSGTFVSVRAPAGELLRLAADPRVRRVQTKKAARPHLDVALPAIGLARGPDGGRPVPEDGTGVLVGVVDSGFDLSHPMFRDASGRLRVEALLDQSGEQPREFDTAELEGAWATGTGPGADGHGHGTHVASIAAGSRFGPVEGVAPGARLLLVKTNFLDTDTAVAWVFRRAGDRPCVVNLSLGHHFGAHDGTDAEERLHAELSGPGKIVVISAGNEREDDIHIGGRFHPGQVEEVVFDVQRQPDGAAFVVLTLWHPQDDGFAVSLVTPAGAVVAEPAPGRALRRTTASASIDIGQQPYPLSDLVQHQVALDFPPRAGNEELRGWRVRIECRTATVGRLDGWFHNSGFATFRPHPLVESARTVGVAATGPACLAVAAHVSRNTWRSDSGGVQDVRAVVGRSCTFSSLGPTRDGRPKPDVSAPGQYVTAALAAGSREAEDDRLAATADRLLTLAGTSMAAPVVTGAVALLLQDRPDLTPADLRELLGRSARRDAHTGPGPWDPGYGRGKVDVLSALRLPADAVRGEAST